MDDAARMLTSVERDGELDRVAVEEPLEIRVDGEPIAVTGAGQLRSFLELRC